MMNRSLMERQMFARGGQVRYMQDGGMAPMPDQGMPMAPQGMPMGQQGMPMGQQGMPMGPTPQDDPQALQDAMSVAAQNFSSIDEATNFEEVMNGIRGDTATIEERRSELAGMVGPDDAGQTPESVLALIQPVMQMAQVDQGIGSIAPEAMGQTPIEGNMAGGIMSTVNQGAGEVPAPTNFRQGGAVQYFAPENTNRVATPPPDPRFQEVYGQKQAMLQSILSPQDQQQAYADQKNMTQAQILFDIAQGGLALATPGDRQMSFAQRLAEVASPVLGNMGVRAGELEKFKQAQAQEQRALNLQAYGSTETQLASEADRAFKSSESALDRGFELEKQNREFDYKKGADETANDFAQRIQDQKDRVALQIERLKGNNSLTAIELRGSLEADQKQLDRALTREIKASDQAFTKGENETDRGHQTRLVGIKATLARQLQELVGAQGEDAIKLRADLEAQAADLDRQFKLTIQTNEFDFGREKQKDAQTFDASMQEKLFINQNALQLLQGAQSQADINLRTKLETEQIKLKDTLAQNQISINFANTLELEGVRNLNDIAKLNKTFGQSKELAKFGAALDMTAQKESQAHQAGQNALQRMSAQGLQTNAQTFQRLMAEELRGFNATQADIDRAIQTSQQLIDNDLKSRGLDQTDRSMNITELGNLMTSGYNNAKLALEEKAAEATKLGSASKTATLQYLTNADRVTAYANDRLGDQTAEFEQAILDYVTPLRKWDGNLYVETAAPQLNSQLQKAIETRKKNGKSVPTGINVTSEGPQNVPEGATNGTTPLPEVNSFNFNTSLLNPDGSVNLKSESWSRLTTTTFDPNIDYEVATGIGGLGQRLSNFATENFRELAGLQPMDEEGKNLVQADSDLISLKNAALTIITGKSFADDRVLKDLQMALKEEVEALNPGIWQSDERALSSLNSLSKKLGAAFARVAERLPEYGGKVGNYSAAEVTEGRTIARNLRDVTAEVLAFKGAYDSYLTALAPGVTGGSRDDARAKLRELMSGGNQ
jgi:hypothetical protein